MRIKYTFQIIINNEPLKLQVTAKNALEAYKKVAKECERLRIPGKPDLIAAEKIKEIKGVEYGGLFVDEKR